MVVRRFNKQIKVACPWQATADHKYATPDEVLRWVCSHCKGRYYRRMASLTYRFGEAKDAALFMLRWGALS